MTSHCRPHPPGRPGPVPPGPIPEEAGFALIAVMLLLVALLMLSIVAFNESGINSTSSQRTDSAAQADGSASTGLSAAVFDFVSGDFPCQLSSQPVLGSGAPADAGTNTYTANISYYSTTWAAGSAPPSGSSIACTGGVAASAPATAVVVSTGTSSFGAISSNETITEQVAVTPAPQYYAAFSASTAALNLSDLDVPQTAAAAGAPPPPGPGPGPGGGSGTQTAPPEGHIYTAGAVGDSGPCNTEAASIIAFGNSTLNNCNITGSVQVGGGTLTLDNNSTVAGNVTVGGGSVVMSHATVDGDVTASTDVSLCPGNGPEPSQCSALGPQGAATIGGSATADTGTVQIDGSPIGTETPPCSTYQLAGDQIDGCITSTSGQSVTPPSSVSLPTLGPPSQSAWAADGYSGYVTTNNCASVAHDLAAETAPTVIYASCALNLTSLGTITLNYDTAIYATGGFTIGAGTTFQPPAGSTSGSLQLSLIVPAPAGGASCSTNGYNITDSNGGALPTTIATFAYTPCTFSTSAAVTMAGEVVAGAITPAQPLSISYSPFTPPGLVFGYQALVVSRTITQL